MESRRPIRNSELTCNKCGVDLVLGENWNETRKRTRNYMCTPCYTEYHNTYYQANKGAINERVKEWRKGKREYCKVAEAARRYKATKEEIAELLKEAECSICGVTEKLVIDHDHVTGNIRGILCHSCNVGLGHFKDNVDLLERAKEYLNG